jgi:hypothetical protein
MKEQQFMRKLQ